MRTSGILAFVSLLRFSSLLAQSMDTQKPTSPTAGRTFEAVRFDVHQTGYKVSLFASSVVVGVDGVMDHHLQGNNLYGVYGSFKNAIPKATLEPYILWRLAPADAGLPETANRGHLNETTIGLRLAGALPAAFDYEIEMDRQTGSLGANSIRAWAGYWSPGRTFRGLATAPWIFIESNYASGSKNPSGHTWGTFDQIYPSITTSSPSRTNSAGKTFYKYAQAWRKRSAGNGSCGKPTRTYGWRRRMTHSTQVAAPYQYPRIPKHPAATSATQSTSVLNIRSTKGSRRDSAIRDSLQTVTRRGASSTGRSRFLPGQTSVMPTPTVPRCRGSRSRRPKKAR
jgi:hypothetical protein